MPLALANPAEIVGSCICCAGAELKGAGCWSTSGLLYRWGISLLPICQWPVTA